MEHTECKDCELSNGDCGYHFKMDGVTNYDIPSLSACDQYGNCEFFKPKAKSKGDLISRETLKKQVQELLDLAVKRVDDTPSNSPCYRMYVEQENERARLIDLIDNAPTVNIEDEIAGAYNEGYMCGSREAEKERPQGKWIKHEDYNENCKYGCNQCGNLNNIPSNICPNCKAEMRGEQK